MRLAAALTVIAMIFPGSRAGADSKTSPIGDAADKAIAKSKITSPGAIPFHLKATIDEVGEADSDFKAQIEEFWLAPDKWRRTIQSPDFSQTIIVNGNMISELDMGDYYPFWLRNLVTAIFDPLPMLQSLHQASAQIQNPNGSEHTTACARFESRVGIPPVQTSAFSVFCFEGSQGLLDSVVTPAYSAVFSDYKAFKEKRVARRIVIDPEPGTTIEAKVAELTELTNADDGLFVIHEPTAETTQLRSIPVSEEVLRSMSLATPDIVWPSIKMGKASGVLSMYVSVDRAGQVQEAWPLNSDNADLEGPAREQVRKWRFKPAAISGVPVQIESVLTFAFTVKTE
jgi:hypothetical protein